MFKFNALQREVVETVIRECYESAKLRLAQGNNLSDREVLELNTRIVKCKSVLDVIRQATLDFYSV